MIMTVLAVLPSPEQVKAVRKAAARGIRPAIIGERVFGTRTQAHLVHKILANPTAFSRDVDDVAVDRAFGGDPDVWANLTHLEKRIVLARVLERRRRELAVNKEWSEFYKKARNGATHSDRRKGDQPFPYSFHTPPWAVELVKASGFASFESLMDKARLLERRGGQVAV